MKSTSELKGQNNLALNRAIAEKIMGLSDFDFTGQAYNPTKAEGFDTWTQVPDYTGDANLAMQVVEEMRKTHFMRVDFERNFVRVVAERWGATSSRFELAAETFGLAVCLAALKAGKHSIEGLQSTSERESECR